MTSQIYTTAYHIVNVQRVNNFHNNCFAGSPATAMQATDEAADSTLQELLVDLCDSKFQPLRSAIALKDKGIIGDDLFQKCELRDLTEYQKREAIIVALRDNGEQGIFQSFIAILETDPANNDIVQKLKGIMITMWL